MTASHPISGLSPTRQRRISRSHPLPSVTASQFAQAKPPNPHDPRTTHGQNPYVRDMYSLCTRSVRSVHPKIPAFAGRTPPHTAAAQHPARAPRCASPSRQSDCAA